MKTNTRTFIDALTLPPECRKSAPTTPTPLRATLNKVVAITALSVVLGLAVCQTGCATGGGSSAEKAASLDSAGRSALQDLYATSSVAKNLSTTAKAILVFPDIMKAGFIVGAQTGNGVLFQNGKAVGYYNTTAASYGLQAGIQKFGYALFLMTDAAMEHIHDTGGFELGVGPSIVVVDEGMGKSMSTTTLRKDIYAFIFSQKGLMAGLGLQGSKITEIHP